MNTKHPHHETTIHSNARPIERDILGMRASDGHEIETSEFGVWVKFSEKRDYGHPAQEKHVPAQIVLVSAHFFCWLPPMSLRDIPGPAGRSGQSARVLTAREGSTPSESKNNDGPAVSTQIRPTVYNQPLTPL